MPLPRLISMPLPLRYAFLAALVMSALKILASYLPFVFAGVRYPWQQFLAVPFLGYFLWALIAPLVYHFFKSAAGLRAWGWRWSCQALLAVTVACLHGFCESAIYIVWVRLAGGADLANTSYLSNIILQSFVEYWIIIGAFAAIDLALGSRDKLFRLALAEKQLTLAQLRALKMQLNPHFLFNALHSVGALMEDSIDDAQKVLARLAHLLRSMLDADNKHTVTLGQEMTWLNDYLLVEGVRFGERLQVKREIAEDTLQAVVPYLILQPLVENAVKHGLARSGQVGQITLISRRVGDRLQLEVVDNGAGCPDPSRFGKGVGTRNVRERLDQIFAGNYQLRFYSPEGGGFGVLINIPFSLEHPTL